MISSEKQAEASQRKQKIRERYKGIDPSELEVIPAKESEDLSVTQRVLKVAAYVRVSTENDEQTSSFELQSNEFTEQIQGNPNWEFAGIYSDEGISGTELSHRKGMLQMLEDAKAGKIDLILTKSIARFARNIVDCLSVIEILKNLEPPVGVKFETDNIYTLDNTGRMILTILASVAEEESHSKSLIMNWSIDKRFSRGLFLLPELLGFDKDEDGNLVVNEEEAETVKVIYDLYINGVSVEEIAKCLTTYKRKTKRGNTSWSGSTLSQIIQNERYCGDVLARKTYTPNFLTHKSKKNRNNRTQYRKRDHHEAIVSREVFDAANHLQAAMKYSRKKKPLPVLSVVDDGILRGYVPLDKDWSGFSGDDYLVASQSVYDHEPDKTVKTDSDSHFNLFGYKYVRAQYFSTMRNPALTISDGKLRFNTACLKKFKDVEYVELLLNSVSNMIAVRPCSKDNPNAIHWGRLREERWIVSNVCCRGFAKVLFDMQNWDTDKKYRFRGQFISNGTEKMMLFELDEPEMIQTVVQEIPLQPYEDSDQDQTNENPQALFLKRKILTYPEEWQGCWGRPADTKSKIGILVQRHYYGDWQVLRPATELEQYNVFSSESMRDLMEEAEQIMKGWQCVS